MENPRSLDVVSVSCTALGKSYEAELDGRRWRHAVLRDLALSVRAGRCTAVVGAGLGPVTVLRCLAGLVAPERGSLVWRASDGRPVAPPSRMLVAAGWRPYSCQTVADVLQAAVPAGRSQAEADCAVGLAARQCALAASLERRVIHLSPAAIRLVATAAAVVGGARWLLLDRREAIDVLADHEDPRSVGCVGSNASAVFQNLLEAAVLRSLVSSGHTIVVAGPEAHCMPLLPEAVITLARGRLCASREPGTMRRVAERQRPDMRTGNGGATACESEPVDTAPVATASGSL